LEGREFEESLAHNDPYIGTKLALQPIKITSDLLESLNSTWRLVCELFEVRKETVQKQGTLRFFFSVWSDFFYL
jgi:hypothetical protein